MKRIWITIGLLHISWILLAQHPETGQKVEMWKGKHKQTEDTTSLLYAFKNGHVHGHFRYYFMATDNASGLTDYYANAIGGGIKYETAPFKRFQLGVSGFFVFNIGSSNLAKPDPSTSQQNRYEIGLFDITDPENKTDIDRLEELYLKYSWKKSHISFGKQLINTPFINLQDGRMRPTEVGGLYGEVNDIKNTKIEGGYLYEMSPRSTVEWYKIGETMGIYPQGVNPDGTRSGYAENIESDGVFLLGVTHKMRSDFSLQAWDVFVENVFNTAMLQLDYRYPLQQKNSSLFASVQYIRQDAIKDGGNEDPSKTFFQKGGQSNVFGARIGWENQRWQTSVNYTRITADGRFLMPREWGKEPFFTFLPRERNDGLGDVNAYALKVSYGMPKAGVKLQGGWGYYDLPAVTQYTLNKYGMPSYTQLNINASYEFKGFLKGMEAALLYVYKGKQGNTAGNDKYVINKVNVSIWNMVINYHF